jgi:molybdate transport system substrate-binding protein
MRFLIAFLISLVSVAAAPAESINVGAAISLKESLEAIAREYKKAGGDTVVFQFASSGQIMGLIKAKADVDVFISAADRQMDELTNANLVDAATRRVIVGNTLVLVVPAGSTLAIKSFDDLESRSVRQIAAGDPKSVPAGDYTSQVLAARKLTDKVSDRLIYGANVRQVLGYVEAGKVDAGIIYATDAKESGDKVRVVAAADAKDHGAIVYPAAMVSASARKAAAKKFLDYLGTEPAKNVFKERGFTIPAAQAPK